MSRIHEALHPSVARVRRPGAICALLVLMLGGTTAGAQARGYMLYNQYCVECHTEQVHWRDQRLATDWKSLSAQVRRWQAVAQLNWSEDDVQYVTRYLNTRYYDFLPPTQVTRGTGHGFACCPPQNRCCALSGAHQEEPGVAGQLAVERNPRQLGVPQGTCARSPTVEPSPGADRRGRPGLGQAQAGHHEGMPGRMDHQATRSV